jgi:hypothetical protein
VSSDLPIGPRDPDNGHFLSSLPCMSEYTHFSLSLFGLAVVFPCPIDCIALTRSSPSSPLVWTRFYLVQLFPLSQTNSLHVAYQSA